MDFSDLETQNETQNNDDDYLNNDIHLDLFGNFTEKTENYFVNIDFVVFLIDCLSIHYIEVLIVAEEFLKSKIVSNESDKFSLILYNSSITNNQYDFPGVNLIVSEANPSAELILKLRNEYEILKKDFLKNEDSS